MHRNVRRVTMLVVLSALVALATLPATSSATRFPLVVPSSDYAVVVSPGTVSGGATVTMTATVTNEMALRQIEAAELFWPAPLQVLSASVPAHQGVALITTCHGRTGMAPCVLLHDLDVPPGKSVVVTLSVRTPPGCATATGTWAVAARSDGLLALLSLLLGNGNLTLDTAHSSLQTTVAGCHLQFATQPHDAVIHQDITGSDDNPSGPAVTVDILELNGSLAASTAPVAITLANNPGGSTLTGTTTAPGNPASFGSLQLDQPGDGYTLTASSSGMTGATSSSFSEAAQATPCDGSCSLQQAGSGGFANVGASGGTTGTLVTSVNAPGEPPLTCAGYTSIDPDTYEFSTTSSSFSKTVKLTLLNPIGVPVADPTDTDGFTIPGGDGDNDYDDVLWNAQICFQATYQFTTNAGTPAPSSTVNGATVYTGLLPTCTESVTGPCHARDEDKVVPDENAVGYDIVLVAQIPAAAGDPRMN